MSVLAPDRRAATRRLLDRLSPALILQLARFGLVGATNTVVTLAVYAGLVAVGAPAVGAAILSWTLGAANGYRLNRAWTFRSAHRGTGPAVRYTAVQGVGAGLNALAVAVLVGHEHLPRLAGELVALPFAAVLTFVLCRRWVFGAHRAA